MMAGELELESLLKYHFSDSNLLNRALTHRSKSSKNYERLEFLGDAVLGLTVSDVLYKRFPDSTEGILSRLRASLVRQRTLAEVARKMGLGHHIRLGSGELKSGGYDRDSILADVFESLVGAIYLDGGPEAARSFIEKHMGVPIAQVDPKTVGKDPKSRLQEYLQQRALPVPSYTIVSVSGEPHQQYFVVACEVAGLEAPATGEGSSRRRAEVEAAERAYAALTQANG